MQVPKIKNDILPQNVFPPHNTILLTHNARVALLISGSRVAESCAEKVNMLAMMILSE